MIYNLYEALLCDLIDYYQTRCSRGCSTIMKWWSFLVEGQLSTGPTPSSFDSNQ